MTKRFSWKMNSSQITPFLMPCEQIFEHYFKPYDVQYLLITSRRRLLNLYSTAVYWLCLLIFWPKWQIDGGNPVTSRISVKSYFIPQETYRNKNMFWCSAMVPNHFGIMDKFYSDNLLWTGGSLMVVGN